MNRSREDKLLVDRVLAGDREAFREFFKDQFPRLFRFALTRTDRDEDLAEEIAQATLCKAIQKLDTFRGEAPLFSWLCTFARHELWHRGRRRHEVNLLEDSPELQAAIDSLEAGEDSDPESCMQKTEAARLVQVALDRLPTKYGNVLEWKYLRGETVNQIAMRLGVRPKAAESTLTRARDAFRDAFTALTRESMQSRPATVTPFDGGNR